MGVFKKIRVWVSRVCAALLVSASAAAMGAASAQAADLGGNCCADLEERIAELEATTARKGNRKVSLTISGWVNEALFAWDDGVEKNVYVGTNALEQSRVRFTGEAKINGDWSAGYTLELGINGADSKGFNQDNDDGGNSGIVSIRKSNWWLKSKSLGKVTVGREGTATYHLLDDADGANTRNYSDAEATAVYLSAFRIRSSGSTLNNLRWVDLMGGVNNDTPGQNGRRDIVRYDSPAFGGFNIIASWGEDDQWGGALVYKGDIGDFSVLGRVGYENSTDDLEATLCNGRTATQDCNWYGAAGTIKHNPTGLYVYGGWGQLRDDARSDPSLAAAGAAGSESAADDKDTMWFIQAGIEQKWLPLGKTTIFGEYRHDDTGSQLSSVTTAAQGCDGCYVHDADLDNWAVGVVQNVEPAAMDLYLMYRHAEGDFNVVNRDGTAADSASFKLDDFDMVIAGARIQF